MRQPPGHSHAECFHPFHFLEEELVKSYVLILNKSFCRVEETVPPSRKATSPKKASLSTGVQWSKMHFSGVLKKKSSDDELGGLWRIAWVYDPQKMDGWMDGWHICTLRQLHKHWATHMHFLMFWCGGWTWRLVRYGFDREENKKLHPVHLHTAFQAMMPKRHISGLFNQNQRSKALILSSWRM